jgi:rubrerythrin
MFGAKTIPGLNIRDPWVEKICPHTTESCCHDDFYNNMNTNWLKLAAHFKKIARLEDDLVQMIFTWLNAKDLDGKSALRKKLDTIKADPNCGKTCKLQITALGLFKTRFNDESQQLDYIQENSKCNNHILSRKAAWFCPICDERTRKIIKTNKEMSIGEVHVDPSMCADVFNGCHKSNVHVANLLGGVYGSALQLIKSWKSPDWSVKDFAYTIVSVPQIQSCTVTWDRFKGVSRNVDCIDICEKIWSEIISPKPRLIDASFINGVKIMFEYLGSDPGILKRVGELQKLNTVTDPYLKPFDEIPHFGWKAAWRAKNTEWMNYFTPFKGHEKIGPEGEVYTNGLDKQALLIPARVSGAGLIGIGKLVIGVVSLLLVFGIGS